MPATPFDDPAGGTGGIWAGGLNMLGTPFISPPQHTEMSHRVPWVSATTTAMQGAGTGTGLYTHPVSDQVIDAAGFFYPDKVSSTQT